MQIDKKDIVKYKRLHHVHLTLVDDTPSAHSKREQEMADIAAKYGMSNNEFLWTVINR